MSRYLSIDGQVALSELVAKAIAEYLDGDGSYSLAIRRMSLATYVVDEIDGWIRDLATTAIDLDRMVGG